MPAARAIACCCATLVALLAAAPSALAGPSTRADRIAAAGAFATRTLTFDAQQTAALRDVQLALASRRATAADCLALWQTAPPARRTDLGLLYFEYLSGALWSVDAALFRHWITDLRRSKRIDRSPQLARAADALRSDYVFANSVYTAVPDACAALTRWRAAGWSDAARPAVLATIGGLPKNFAAATRVLIDAGRRQLVRYAGRRGKAAAEVLRIGVDEPDSRLSLDSGCDPVGALVLPDTYRACPG